MASNDMALHYALRLVRTESGTGYFACFPEEDLDFDACLRHVRAHPNDEFMRKHLLRWWEMKTTVRNERHRYRFEGAQTAYGRGLDLESARVACAMEIVKRCSAYTNFVPGGITGYRKAYPLLHTCASDLSRQHVAHLDLNRLTLEAPYADAPLYWIEGEEADGNRSRSVFVPAQCVFLFCNLDEC